MSRGTVLSLCDRTGHMVRPWLDAGYRAVTVDVQEAANSDKRRVHLIADVRKLEWIPPDVCFVAAFPPCTHFAVSGARWFREKGLDVLIEALEIVNACRKICEASGAPWMLENPVGTLSNIIASLGLTQAEASRIFGVSDRAIRTWMTGDRAVPEPLAKLMRLVASGKLNTSDVENA